VTQADTVDRLAQICTKAPVLIRNSHGEPVPNPVFVRHERASAALVQLAALFGLAPSERSRLSTGTANPYDPVRTPPSDLLSPAGYDPRRNRDLFG
jgi:phage terminase small subunit